MEGEGDDTFSSGGDTAENYETRTPTLDQDQEGDGTEEMAEFYTDSVADDTIDLLDGLQYCNRCLQNCKRDLESVFDNFLERNRYLAAEVSCIQKMTKDLGRMAGDLTRHLNLSKERDTKAANEQVQISCACEEIVEAFEASEVSESGAATGLMANAPTVSLVVAVVLLAGALAALAAAVYFQNFKKM